MEMNDRAEPALELAGVRKSYGSFLALEGLDLRLDRGQILGFIGPNGAGKTTTIKILVGLSRPTSGTAAICGTDCVRDARARAARRYADTPWTVNADVPGPVVRRQCLNDSLHELL